MVWQWMVGKSHTLPTIWEIPYDLWEQIHRVILEMYPPKSTGRKRADPRRMLDGIIFRMRTGCHWNRLLRELGVDGTIHGTLQRWVVEGFLAWLSKCRAILVRYDMKGSNYTGLIQLACSPLWYRRQWQLKV